MSIYDIIAKIAIFLHETNDEYNIVSDYNCCINFCELPFDLDLSVGFSHLGSYDEFDWLDVEVDNLIQIKNFQGLIQTIQALDAKIDYYDYDYYDDENDVFDPLNSKFLDKVFVLPRMFRATKWTHSNDDLSETINKVLNYVFLVFKSELGEYKLINHYVNLNYQQGEFIVAGAPVGNKTQVRVNDVVNGDNVKKMTFEISYKDKSEFINKVVEIINKVDKMRASFIAFPELISNYELNNHIIEKIKNIDFSFLKFIALPTYYDKVGYKNIGDVYYTEEKRMLFSQNKTFPYVKYCKKQDVKEMLCQNNEINILHIRGVGRIVFPICKDMLIDKYMTICKAVKANLIITRSFSPGEYNYKYFSRIIKGYTSFECCGFWINSCSYKLDTNNKNKVICITAHSKCDHNEDNELNSIYHCKEQCDSCIIKFTVN